MKRLSTLFLLISLRFKSTSYAFGLDDAKKTKKISVYSIITDEDKISNLKDLPLNDLKKINSVVQACKIS